MITHYAIYVHSVCPLGTDTFSTSSQSPGMTQRWPAAQLCKLVSEPELALRRCRCLAVLRPRFSGADERPVDSGGARILNLGIPTTEKNSNA
jgi:hypothetical protein